MKDFPKQCIVETEIVGAVPPRHCNHHSSPARHFLRSGLEEHREVVLELFRVRFANLRRAILRYVNATLVKRSPSLIIIDP